MLRRVQWCIVTDVSDVPSKSKNVKLSHYRPGQALRAPDC